MNDGNRSGLRFELSGVTAGYGGADVVRNLDVVIEPGQVVSVLGPNGAGKTTLVRIMCGMINPRAGVISIDGTVVKRFGPENAVQAGIATVPEGRGIFPTMSVEENLIIGAWAQRKDRGRVLSDSAEMYSRFPILGKRRHQRAASLSGGEAQMLAIAMALMARPRMVIFDEPSLGLAPLIVNEVIAQCRSLANSGVSVVLVEQSARKALSIADSVYVLALGQTVFRGTPQEAQRGDLFRSAYMGPSSLRSDQNAPG